MSETIMSVNGLKCTIHMPDALQPKFMHKKLGRLWVESDGTENKGDEYVNQLPPRATRYVFPVDEYPACPANWMHGSAKASSYWTAIHPGKGMWLDFNDNQYHTHHVAVVLSVQGINPITGQQTKSLRLEQYRENCPVHGVPFGQDRYCEGCGHKWDAQNYISTTSTPRGYFWLDGFRGGDGVVRQYVFTEETCKGVAVQIIGEDRVFAVGIAFYLSKEPKPVEPIVQHQNCFHLNSYGLETIGPGLMKGSIHKKVLRSKPNHYGDVSIACNATDFDTTCDFDPMEKLSVQTDLVRDMSKHEKLYRHEPDAELEIKKIEITQGAKINQRIYQDNNDLGFWQDEPAGMVYLNYCDIDAAEKIEAGGRKKKSESFLDKLAGV